MPILALRPTLLALLAAHATLVAQARPAEATVATHYFYWYAHPAEHFPTALANGSSTDGHFHHFVAPEAVDYRDPAWHAEEFRAMAAAGIDVALPVYWGFDGAEGLAGVAFADVGLPPMVAALDALRAADAPAVRLGMFYDTSTLLGIVRGVDGADGGRADLTTAAGRALFVDTVLRFFRQVPERHWALHRGRPLVVLYSAGFAERFDATLGRALGDAFAAEFGARPFLVADESWGDIGQDATCAWGAALAGARIRERPVGVRVAQLGPGYDDSTVPGRRTPHRPREDGAFYRAAWRDAIAADPELVLIETWNELHEGTEICRTVETGDRYLRLTRDAVDRMRRGEPGPPVALQHAGPVLRPDRSWGQDAAGAAAVRWSTEGPAGLRPLAWEDGPFQASAVGLTARCPDGRPATYLYLQVADAWRFDVDLDCVLEVDADGTGWWVEYDSRDATATLDGAYTAARPVSASARRSVVELPHARLASRQNGGADLRIVLPRGASLELRAVRLAPRGR